MKSFFFALEKPTNNNKCLKKEKKQIDNKVLSPWDVKKPNEKKNKKKQEEEDQSDSRTIPWCQCPYCFDCK